MMTGRRSTLIKSLVKPEYNPQIAPYFANLTGITTDMLAGADTFKTAFEKFAGWCAGCQDAFTVIAWSRKRLPAVQQRAAAERAGSGAEAGMSDGGLVRIFRKNFPIS